MYLRSGDLNFRRKRRNNPIRILIYVVLILGGLWVYRGSQSGEIQPAFVPTPTATRTAQSYAEEAARQFSAGRLDAAAAAYRQATQAEPDNIDYWIALARVETYAGETETAVESAQTAVLLDDNNANAHAVLSLALDWNGQAEEASDAAVRAIGLDGNNALAHAYYAEALTDLARFAQAGDSIRLALSLDPNSMDVRRVYGYFLESVGAYEDAIQQYQAAALINPNLPYLYIRLGANYRVLNQYQTAIEAFQRAASLNPQDVGPLLSISRTYFQTGEYGRAAQYLEAAMEIEPDNAGIYARRGMVFIRSLNYEGAVIDMRCAIEGCAEHPETGARIEPVALSQSSLEWYYSYTSLLAAYEQCDDTFEDLMRRLGPYAAENEVVAGILAENRTICDGVYAREGVAPPVADTEGEEPTPDGSTTPTPTPSLPPDVAAQQAAGTPQPGDNTTNAIATPTGTPFAATAAYPTETPVPSPTP